jgi:hypothetical protein
MLPHHHVTFRQAVDVLAVAFATGPRASGAMPGAANAVVPKNGMGMAFWIAGVPGSADMVKVKAPSAIVPGISRFGRFVLRNSAAAMGKTAKATTNADPTRRRR